MGTSPFCQLEALPRPPALSPRRRHIEHSETRRLRTIVADAVGAPDRASISITEWMAVDCRATPHRVFIVVTWGRRRRTLSLSIDKRHERIAFVDVRAAVEGLRHP